MLSCVSVDLENLNPPVMEGLDALLAVYSYLYLSYSFTLIFYVVLYNKLIAFIWPK